MCDDTIVFVLFVHFYDKICSNKAPMTMSSPKRERAVGLLDIRATAAKHIDIASDLLAIHGLSGVDTVASLHGL